MQPLLLELRQSLDLRDLLDAAPPKAFEDRVRDLALGVEGVRAVEKCRIRKSGTAYFVELHVEVDGDASVAAGHVVGGKVRTALRSAPLRIADAFIHIEPFTAPASGTP
jgi:divalent metal cation (Fe/Co/Zn/Cd) transporter